MKTTDKHLPVLRIGDFKESQSHHPGFYIQPVREHIEENAFIQRPHRHDFYTLIFFSQGRGEHTIDFSTYAVEPGRLFFMSPAQMHTWQLSPDADGYILFFTPEFYLLPFNQQKLFEFPFFSAMGHSPFLSPETHFVQFVAETVGHIYEEFKGNEARKEEILRSYLDILLIKIANVYPESHLFLGTPHVAHQIRRLEMLIDGHFREHLPVTQYADWLHLSPKQLQTICKSALGKSVSDLIGERLLLEAKRLLKYSDQTVTQIADVLNFSDDSYFIRFFKKSTGQTPEIFRLHDIPSSSTQ